MNLDRLRAAAIALVVVSHVAQMWPSPLPDLTRFTVLGAYGVDLFFVLSGWLVGGLFWRELAASGTVAVPMFVARRILRTVPCYLVALALAWGAVRAVEPQRAGFDWAYLFFLQNFKETMPYFLVSWSLCIEEHFYLLMPLSMLAVHRVRPEWLSRLWPVCFVPLALRALTAPADPGLFGRPWTATHFRFEGLLAGVLAAWVYRNDPAAWAKLVRWSKIVFVPALAAAVVLFFVGHHPFYVAGVALLALGFLGLLVSTVGAEAKVGIGHQVIRAIALGSYSAYLTHALMIHVARWLITRFAIESPAPRLAIFAVTIAAGATAFYQAIERPSLALRDRLTLRRQLPRPVVEVAR